MLYNYNNNRCTLHIKMTFGHHHAYFQIVDESIDLNFKNCIFHPVFSYTLTGAVRTERTENIVEQSDWLLESKVYC